MSGLGHWPHSEAPKQFREVVNKFLRLWKFLKNRLVFGLGGFGGQAILIDVENSRIVVINSIQYNNGKYKYNVKL